MRIDFKIRCFEAKNDLSMERLWLCPSSMTVSGVIEILPSPVPGIEQNQENRAAPVRNWMCEIRLCSTGIYAGNSPEPLPYVALRITSFDIGKPIFKGLGMETNIPGARNTVIWSKGDVNA